MKKRRTILLSAAVLALLLGSYWSIHRVWSIKPPSIPMSESIRRGDIEAVERYLASGGSPDAEIEISGVRMTVLEEAIVDRETEIALALLDAGADFSASGAKLSDVAANGMTELVDRLLPLVESDDVAVTGVGNAAGHGYFDTVQSYLRFSEGRRTDEWAHAFGESAIAAMLGGYDDVARALIDAGAHWPDMLHAAARFSSPGMVRHLLARGADPLLAVEPPVADVRERTPLDFAWKGYEDRVGMQGEPGVSDEYLNGRDAEYVLFELMRAGAQTNNPELLSVARDGLAEIRAAPADAQLTVAARIGFIDVVEELLNTETPWSADALREAVVAALLTDHDDIARLLLDRGAPVDGGVLHAAANASSAGIVRDLLHKRADPEERVDGKTPVASWFERSSAQDPGYILHELIRAGADVCWLRSYEAGLRGFSRTILRDSATHCWDDEGPSVER